MSHSLNSLKGAYIGDYIKLMEEKMEATIQGHII